MKISCEQMGKDAWLSGTSPDHLDTYLISKGVILSVKSIDKVRLGFNECQFMLITSNAFDLSERLMK